MQFLRTLFWVVVAVAAVIFATRNWVTIPINLWGGLQADIKLPVLIFGAFLIGLLPPWAWHRATRWSLKRRLETTERALAEARAASPEPAPRPGEVLEPAVVPVPPAVA